VLSPLLVEDSCEQDYISHIVSFRKTVFSVWVWGSWRLDSNREIRHFVGDSLPYSILAKTNSIKIHTKLFFKMLISGCWISGYCLKHFSLYFSTHNEYTTYLFPFFKVTIKTCFTLKGFRTVSTLLTHKLTHYLLILSH
jgi:hypothetical protein